MLSRIAFLLLLIGTNSFAKSVVLDWKEDERAVLYEFQVEKDGKVVLHKQTEDSTWKGQLPFGVYVVRVRGIDQFKRPGKWSEATSLVVMPPVPEPVNPPDSQTIVVKTPPPQGKTVATVPEVFEWKGENPQGKYLLEVSKDGNKFFSSTIGGLKSAVFDLEPGEYRWRVKSVLVFEGAKSKRAWESEWSDSRSLSIEKPTPPQTAGSGKNVKRSRLSLGLAGSLISFKQTAILNSNTVVMDPRVAYEYWLQPGTWRVGAQGTFFSPTVHKSGTGPKENFFDADLTGGYALHPSADWRFILNGGFFFSTFLSHEGHAGYADLRGIEFRPEVEKKFNSKNTLTLSLKLVAISSQVSTGGFSQNHQLSAGAKWTLPPNQSGNSWFTFSDFKTLKIQNGASTIQSRVFSVGAGYAW